MECLHRAGRAGPFYRPSDAEWRTASGPTSFRVRRPAQPRRAQGNACPNVSRTSGCTRDNAPERLRKETRNVRYADRFETERHQPKDICGHAVLRAPHRYRPAGSILSSRNCFKLLVKMISASPIAGCPSFKFLTMQMQPSASCARMWTVLSATIMFADKPHRLNERTSAQRFCVLTILPPVTALAVGLPAQRAIAQRFRALARLRHAVGHYESLLIGVDRK